MMLLALLLTACLSYWPCGIRSLGAYYPDHRIKVIDTIGVRDGPARSEWNHCGVKRLVSDNDLPLYSPYTITIVSGEKGDYPRGGWFEDHGVLFLPPGSWERSIPVITHELGHALGFNHTQKDSVMGGRNRVQPLDCQGLRATYE